MSEDKFTPGPWRACDPGDYSDFDGHSIVILSSPGPGTMRIAVVQGDDDEAIATARLMASAPELREALIAIRDGGPEGGKDFAEWHPSYRPAIDKARAAIAKATGEQA